MKFRLAKPADAKRIAEIRGKIKEVNSLGLFVLMGGSFLRTYYKLVLSDPHTYSLCAIDNDGKILGYSFNIVDSEKHNAFIYRHKFKLALSALVTLLKKPSLIKPLYLRYKSLKNNDSKYVSAKGARGGYWGWDPDSNDSFSSLELRERMHALTKTLGIDIIHFEVDNDNTNVYKIHKLSGAILDREVILADGRKRSLMHYDERIRKPLIKI